MPNQITQLSEQGYLVNGKAVYQSESGKWIPEVQFEYFEIELFKKHLKAIQNGVKVKFKNIQE
ncbi:hypothetical protein [Faecalibacter macacae]|uniref:Uncharacterized protein n=1 Tax=Faecalibacter macacae TaxID=1859289 RepID=A0A3L9MBD3_9FLAO|nr:hypothetical protein [Faecalibacter macacae]RLZ08574.1 hypothetical protein EAH69_09675 [Faecalibacter macacae]